MLNGQAPATDLPPPRLNEHHRQLLTELGYSNSEIEQLAAEQAIDLNTGPAGSVQ